MPEENGDLELAGGRPFWSGTVSFGLVSVPVNVLPGNRTGRVSLRMVSPAGNPLSRRFFTTRDEKELGWEDIVRGYEIEKDRYVVLEDDELERLAPERSRDIDLRVFVPVDQIDPMHFERAYYLTPAGGSTKAYRLLARVMEETGRAGIATFVMRAKEYLVAILAENGILRAETLRFADELRKPEDVELPDPVSPKPADVSRMTREIERLTETKFDPSELVDVSAERLVKLAEKKAKAGKDVVGRAPEPESDEGIVDLVAILQRSLKGGGAAPARKAAKKTAARPAAKRTKKAAAGPAAKRTEKTAARPTAKRTRGGKSAA